MQVLDVGVGSHERLIHTLVELGLDVVGVIGLLSCSPGCCVCCLVLLLVGSERVHYVVQIEA